MITNFTKLGVLATALIVTTACGSSSPTSPDPPAPTQPQTVSLAGHWSGTATADAPVTPQNDWAIDVYFLQTQTSLTGTWGECFSPNFILGCTPPAGTPVIAAASALAGTVSGLSATFTATTATPFRCQSFTVTLKATEANAGTTSGTWTAGQCATVAVLPVFGTVAPRTGTFVLQRLTN